MLNLGWVDFSKSDRDMVLSVLRQLTEPGAVDELGIGTIRDGFSNILFPGTSTLQTRAKYFFIIPYICMELERSAKYSPHQFLDILEKNEIALIDILVANSAEGVIGQRSRQSLRRKPSSIYWNALRTYGFVSEPVSLFEYAALTHARKAISEHRKGLGKQKAGHEEDATDDSDTGMSGAVFWRIPPAPKNWRESLTINLTVDEAIYLRERITSMPDTCDSLLALILREKRLDFIKYEHFDEINAMQARMPPEMLRDYRLARDFSRFIFGAQVRYNIIYSDGRNEEANKRWEQYREEKPSVNLDDIQRRLKPHSRVMGFLKAYQAAIGNENKLDDLIICREKDLKGGGRAKLMNTELYPYNDNSVNMKQLNYRLSNVQRIVGDIFEGMKIHA